MTAYVEWAYFNAQVESEIYVEIPEEDFSEHEHKSDLVGQLRLSLYGTREVAAS